MLNTPLPKTNQFLLFGLIAHIYIILFISGYAYIMSVTNTASSASASASATMNHKTPNPFILSSLFNEASDDAGGFKMDTLFSNDPKWMLNYFSIISIVLLYFSLSLKFTWPIRIEETLIIILLWMLISNTFNTECHCCTSTTSSINGIPTTTTTQETDINEKTAVIVASSIETTDTGDPSSSSSSSSSKSSTIHTNANSNMCSWNWMSIVYSITCLFAALISFLSDIKSHTISLLFRISSFLLMMFIIFMPVSCNQFRFMDLNVLIIKITLYDIIWNMNSYMRFTENELVNEYQKVIDILKDYDITFTKKKKSSSKHRHYHQSSEKQQQYEDDKKKLVTKSDHDVMTLSPNDLFQTLERIGQRLNQPNIVFKSGNSYKKTTLAYYGSSSSSSKKQRNMNTQTSSANHNDFSTSSQLSLFQKAYTIAAQYYNDLWGTRYISWKNRYYNRSINYLIDITRTIWVLAICYEYLPVSLIFILWLLYYIRINSNELKHILLIRKVMSIIHENQIPVFTL